MTCHAVAVSDAASSAVELHDSTPFFCATTDAPRFDAATSDSTIFAVSLDDLHDNEPSP